MFPRACLCHGSREGEASLALLVLSPTRQLELFQAFQKLLVSPLERVTDSGIGTRFLTSRDDKLHFPLYSCTLLIDIKTDLELFFYIPYSSVFAASPNDSPQMIHLMQILNDNTQVTYNLT